jgi:DNA-binding MarR family transcriptional regulator
MNIDKFGIVNDKVIGDPELSIQAKGIYSILCTYANKNRKCFPSIATIADTANVSQRTVDRKIKELKSKNYVRRSGRFLIIL